MIFEQLQSPNCPLHISDRGDFIEFCDSGVSVGTNDKAVLDWLKLRVFDLGLGKVYKEGVLDAGWNTLKKNFTRLRKLRRMNW